jgi:hypothetical protein
MVAARHSAGGRRRMPLVALAIAVFALCAGAYWDAYLRDHATYYRYYTKRWGAFAGLGLIGADQARARGVSYRFLTRGRWGPTYRMEIVNGSGHCPMISPVAPFVGGDLADRDFTSRRNCAWEFEIDADGRGRLEQGFDVLGRRTYAFRYSGDDAATADHDRLDGRSGPDNGASRVVFERILSGARAGLDTVMRFRDRDGRPRQNHQRVYGIRSDYDDEGRRVRATYLDREDRPMADRDGIVTVVVQYNEQGDVASRSYRDATDRPTRTSAGYSTIKVDYDSAGNDVTLATFDPDGKPIARPQGHAAMRHAYDKRGNLELTSYFDVVGRPVRIQSGQSGIRRISDSRGWPIEVVHLDEDGKPVMTTGGNAIERLDYDAESSLVRQQYLDVQATVLWQAVRAYAAGLPVREDFLDGAGRASPRALGNSSIRQTYDKGLLSERVYLDGEGRPKMTTRKFARQSVVYDARGNPVEVAYRDDQNRPTLIDEGYAIVRRQFNDRGDPEEEAFFGIDNEPIDAAFGYARIRIRHDDYGRALEVRYFAADGRPVWPEKDCAFDRSYDAFGRELTTQCMRDGMPAPHPDGWTQRAIGYDDAGNAVRESYFGNAGAPVRDRHGVARVERSYDAWGNVVGQSFFDERGVSAKGPNGCARIVLQFNRVNSNIDEQCLGARGDPAERLDGVSRVIIDRDDRDRVTRSTFHMLRIPDGWPTRVLRQYRDTEGRLRRVEYVDDAGIVRMLQDVDEQARLVAIAFFNVRGEPQRGPAGFARSRVLAFDEFGGADMEFEDERGRAVSPAILVISVTEDKAGARAGLRPYDLILRYDGRDIDYGRFAAVQRAPGREAREIVVLRGNALVQLQAEPRPLDIETEPVERP